MATAFKLRGEILIHDFASHVFVDEATRHDKDVGIVVLTDQMGNLWNPAEAGANRLMLVQRHINAFAGAADGDAGKHLAGFDAAGQGVTEVAVVTRVLAVGAVVLPCDTALVEVLLDVLFKSIASVIGGEAYYRLSPRPPC